jgi:membrane protease YdiL (CAAX protease family)
LLPEKPEDPFGVPMFEQPLSSSWVMLLLGTLGASVWAPLLEEVMFRGTLMTALRTRFNPFLAALLTAVVFGIYHPYGWAGIIPVAVGGFVYGLTRLWRGSLIAPIFAHFLWNTLIGVSEVGTIALLN